MKKLYTLDGWDFPHTVDVPDGYNTKEIPDISRENFNKLLKEYNNLVEVVNVIVSKIGLEYDDE